MNIGDYASQLTAIIGLLGMGVAVSIAVSFVLFAGYYFLRPMRKPAVIRAAAVATFAVGALLMAAYLYLFSSVEKIISLFRASGGDVPQMSSLGNAAAFFGSGSVMMVMLTAVIFMLAGVLLWLRHRYARRTVLLAYGLSVWLVFMTMAGKVFLLDQHIFNGVAIAGVLFLSYIAGRRLGFIRAPWKLPKGVVSDGQKG